MVGKQVSFVREEKPSPRSKKRVPVTYTGTVESMYHDRVFNRQCAVVRVSDHVSHVVNVEELTAS